LPCQAGFEVLAGDVVKLTDGVGNSGGVFHADVLYRTAATPDFDTFCVEVLEHISLGTAYYVDSVGLVTKSTNRNLTSKVAWLYTQFDEGNASKLPGFNFTTPTAVYANALQYGIWRELNPSWTDADIAALPGPWTLSYITDTLTPILDNTTNGWLGKYYADDVANNDWSTATTGSVLIMNLYKFVNVSSSATGPKIREITLADGSKQKIKLKGDAQDQLFRIPPVGSVVPELATFYTAGSVVVGALVFGLISGHRRRDEAAA
jgi:hypothetical protein